MRVKRVIFNTLTISAISFGVIYVANILLTNSNVFASNTGVGMHASIGSAYTMEISSNNVALDIVPSVEGTFKSDYTTVSTYTNTNDTCTVVMTTSSTDLASGDNVIPTLEESAPEATFTNDHWGFRVGSAGDFNSISEENTIVTYNEATGNDGNNTNVYFAAKLTPETKAGTYTNTVTFAATCASSGGGDPKIYMQNITEATLASLMPNVGDSTTLYDSRDEKAYTVAYLADGNYWMTQNLDHDIVTTEGFYTYANTDIGHGSTPNTSATWTADTATYATNDTTWSYTLDEPESYDPGDLCWNGTIRNDWNGTIATDTVACGNDKHYHIGNYYNWTAAVAMNDSSSYTTDKVDVDQSICPAGWRLPTYSGNKSYDNLVTTLSLTSGTSGNVQNTPVYFVYGGDWGDESYGVGGYSGYWSSVVNSNYYAYELVFNKDGYMDPQDGDDRGSGRSVRCVFRGNDESGSDEEISDISDLTYMQDFATLSSDEKTAVLSSMTPNQQYELDDNRDNKTYTISKLADGNVWMTQNLDHDIVTTTDFYTYANTDIGHGSTPNTNATWTAERATYATSNTNWYDDGDVDDSNSDPESYDPGDLCWNGTIRSDNNGAITTDTVACGNDKHYHIGNYYNWTAAVAMNDSSSYTTDQQDVDQSICPAGWRLPTYSGNKSYDNLVTALSLTSSTSGNVQNTPVYFVYGGFWYGYPYRVSGRGLYWSSVVYDGDDAYGFLFSRNGNMEPQGDDSRDVGYSVRCVAR